MTIETLKSPNPFIRLFDEHFARHFESHWRETWRHTGRRTVPQISFQTPSPPPWELPVGPDIFSEEIPCSLVLVSESPPVLSDH